MPKIRHLQHAPITEAIFDIRVKPHVDFDPQVFLALKEQLAPEFPKTDDMVGRQLTFQFSSKGATPPELHDLGVQGYFFKSEDGRLIAQFRSDGFTLNRLHPYTSWSELFPITERLWSLYTRTASPELATRIATRYINRIVLPPDPPSLSRFLAVPPMLPDELDVRIVASLNRTTVRHERDDSSAHITQALNYDDSNGTWILLLDIDVFSEVSTAPTDRRLMALFAQLREFKNLIFFSLLTDHTLGMYG